MVANAPWQLDPHEQLETRGRTANGWRLDDASAPGSRLGFTLDEIAELLDVGAHRHTGPRLQERAQATLADLAIAGLPSHG